MNASVELRRERLIAKADNVHANRYDYSEVVYVNAKTDVTVLCSDHGLFSVLPDKHTCKYPVDCSRCALQAHRAASRYKKSSQKEQWRERPVGRTTARKRPKRNAS